MKLMENKNKGNFYKILFPENVVKKLGRPKRKFEGM
jgi:hypothetical protein